MRKFQEKKRRAGRAAPGHPILTAAALAITVTAASFIFVFVLGTPPAEAADFGAATVGSQIARSQNNEGAPPVKIKAGLNKQSAAPQEVGAVAGNTLAVSFAAAPARWDSPGDMSMNQPSQLVIALIPSGTLWAEKPATATLPGWSWWAVLNRGATYGGRAPSTVAPNKGHTFLLTLANWNEHEFWDALPVDAEFTFTRAPAANTYHALRV